MLKLAVSLLAGLVVLALADVPATAQLADGVQAPDFAASAARGGAVSTFELKSALAKGPVVLYFFPKSFTSGCTIEAHAFSDRIGDFEHLGATVIGVSGDDIETQKRFSLEACRSKFAVVSDTGLRIAKAYDALLLGAFANRTSYVIAPNGRVVEAYTSLEPLGHITNALRALRDLHAKS